MNNVKKIIQTDDFSILQKECNLYTIEFSPYANNQPLIDSITKTNILVGSTSSHDYTQLFFKATTVETLIQHKKKHCLEMTANLINQLQYLIKHTNQCFIGYSPENTIVIDGKKCIYLSIEHLVPIETKKETITITYPFTKNDFFLSPELKTLKVIPSQTHYKTSYYSLACLIIYSLITKDVKTYTIEESDNISDMLECISIKETKLYYLLKRCLHEEPSKRSILFL